MEVEARVQEWQDRPEIRRMEIESECKVRVRQLELEAEAIRFVSVSAVPASVSSSTIFLPTLLILVGILP